MIKINESLTRYLTGISISVFFIVGMVSMAYAKSDVLELKYATIRGATDINAERWEIPLGMEIEKRTRGRVKITHYWSEALGKGRDQFNIVKMGIADMSDFPGSYMPGKFVLSEVGNLPFAAKNRLNIGKAMYQLLKKGYFKDSWNEVIVLAWNGTPFYQLLFNKLKPLSFKDLKSLKIRTPGGYMTEFLKATGAVPVNIAPAEAYQAWEKGIVDGWLHPAGAFKVYKLHELPNRSLLQINAMSMVNAAVIFNKEKWASLGPDLQKIIRKVVLDYASVYDKTGDYQDELAYKLLAEQKVEVYTLPQKEIDLMRKASIVVWEQYIKDADKAGGDGKAIVKEFIRILKSLGEKPVYNIR